MKRIIRLCKTLRKGALQVNEHHTENLIPFFTTKYGHTRFDGFMLIRKGALKELKIRALLYYFK